MIKIIRKNNFVDERLVHIKMLLKSIENENKNKINLWGIQSHSLFEWLGFTTEELGEVSKAISEYVYRKGSKEDIYNELIQTATLCLKMAETIELNG